MTDTKHSIKITLGSGVFDIEVLCHDRIGICGAQWPRKELAALRVLDGASAGRADDERKAMAQQRDEACRERKQYKRAANEARRQRNQAREALAKVREAAGRHPECGKHPKGDPIKCGWMFAVQDIRTALEACDE